jgi:hypothetical protein
MFKQSFAAFLLLLSANAAPAAPVIDKNVIDNARVAVTDIKLAQGESAPATPQDRDSVILYLEGGRFRTLSNGKIHSVTRKFGDAVFVPRGSAAFDTLESAAPAHEILVELKDAAVPPIANTSGYPDAFPRPGSVKMLDNDRVTAWHYSWTRGVPTRMHFHAKEVVVSYRYDGALKSVTPDGKAVVNPYKAGEIHFNKANRTHYEELMDARQSAVILELK